MDTLQDSHSLVSCAIQTLPPPVVLGHSGAPMDANLSAKDQPSSLQRDADPLSSANTSFTKQAAPASANDRTPAHPKPFIPRSGPMLASSPSFPVHTLSSLNKLSFGMTPNESKSARAVSLPLKVLNSTPLLPPSQVVERRVVSLPDPTHFPNFLTFPSFTRRPLARIQEYGPLIDLSTPEKSRTVDLSALLTDPSPSGTIIIHSPHSKSSIRSASPTPSHEDSGSESESVIFVSPIASMSPSFLRRTQSRAARMGGNNPLSARARATRLSTSQIENEAWTPSSPPRPIPALHGPPSLPYARCPSGAEGIMIPVVDQSSMPRMVWGLDENSPAPPKTPHLSQYPFQGDHTGSSGRTSRSRRSRSDHSTPGSLWNTPGSTLGGTPASTIIATPAAAHDDIREKYESHELAAAWEGVKLSRAPEATPGRFTVYQYVDDSKGAADWEEFTPSASLVDSSITSPISITPLLPSVTTPASSAKSHINPLPSASHTAPIGPRTKISTPRNTTQFRTGPSSAKPDLNGFGGSRLTGTPTYPTLPPQRRLRDLPQVTERIANRAVAHSRLPLPPPGLSHPALLNDRNMDRRPPQDLSYTLAQFATLSSQVAPEFWATLFGNALEQNLLSAPSLPSPSTFTLPTASSTNTSPVRPSMPRITSPNIPIRTPTLNPDIPLAPSQLDSPSGISFGTALNNPRSVPIARLRRKLAAVIEEEDPASHGRGSLSPAARIVGGRSSRKGSSTLAGDTQNGQKRFYEAGEMTSESHAASPSKSEAQAFSIALNTDTDKPGPSMRVPVSSTSQSTPSNLSPSGTTKAAGGPFRRPSGIRRGSGKASTTIATTATIATTSSTSSSPVTSITPSRASSLAPTFSQAPAPSVIKNGTSDRHAPPVDTPSKPTRPSNRRRKASNGPNNTVAQKTVSNQAKRVSNP